MAKSNAPRADLVGKEPGTLHKNFAAWLTEQTGYKVDEKSVQLATILRMDFQRSDVNQRDLAARRQAKADAAAAREKRAADRAAKKAAPKPAKKAAPAKPKGDEVAAKRAAKSAPAKPAKKATAAKGGSKAPF